MPRLSRTASKSVAAAGMEPGLFVHSMPGHLVRRLQQVAVRLFTEEIGSDITPVQFAALCAVADRSGIGQAALAALIGYDRATMGGVIDRLEQKGLMARIPSAEDRRSNALALTAAGRKAMQAAIGKVKDVQKRLLAPLDDTEQRRFEAMILKILAHHEG